MDAVFPQYKMLKMPLFSLSRHVETTFFFQKNLSAPNDAHIFRLCYWLVYGKRIIGPLHAYVYYTFRELCVRRRIDMLTFTSQSVPSKTIAQHNNGSKVSHSVNPTPVHFNRNDSDCSTFSLRKKKETN